MVKFLDFLSDQAGPIALLVVIFTIFGFLDRVNTTAHNINYRIIGTCESRGGVPEKGENTLTCNMNHVPVGPYVITYTYKHEPEKIESTERKVAPKAEMVWGK